MDKACLELGSERSWVTINQEKNYLIARANEEWSKAKECDTPQIARIHERMAEQYESLAKSKRPRQVLHKAAISPSHRNSMDANNFTQREGMVSKE